MQKLLADMQNQIARFVEQRDDLVMVCPCTDNDAAILLKLLRDAEQASDTDVYLLFSDDFVAPAPYVSVLAERLREERRIACEELGEQGKPEFPAIPDVVFDAAQNPSYRLYKAISWARSLLPSGAGNRLVWVMCPQKIGDRNGYFDLLSPLLTDRGLQPWMRALRIVVRDQPGASVTGIARARSVPFDAGPQAIENALDNEAQDESLPLDRRMQSLLQLALLDAAHNRTAPAIQKLETLLGHSQAVQDLHMQAVVLNALGDVRQRAGDLEGAQHWYECAVPVAGEAKDGVILLTVVKNLAAVAWTRNQFDVAEQYYDGADKLAAHLLSPEAKIDALLWRGFAQEKQAAYARAVGSWRDAATLAHSIGIPELETNALGHLERVYRQLGMSNEMAAIERERGQISAGGDS